MRTKSILMSCFIAMLLATVACNATPETESGVAVSGSVAVLRVGTYDSRGVALAYGRSKQPDGLLAKVERIRSEHEQAEKDGNDDRMAALVIEVKTLQDEIHRQTFGAAPIDDILALLSKDLPKVAKAAKVDLIVSGVLYFAPGVEVVDVTTRMCAHFEPDAKTQKMIKELMGMEPVDESELSEKH